MLKTILIVSVVVFYFSLIIELFFYKVPSVVLTKKIMNTKYADTSYFSESVQAYFKWSMAKKSIVFLLPQVFIYILHFYPLYLGYHWLMNGISDQNTMQGIIGIILVLFGRLISHLYLFEINKLKKRAFQGFVNKGVFKWSRNPGLIGLYISFLGFILINPSLFIILCYVIYIIHMHFKIIMEEDYLTHKHEKVYLEYIKKTKRYL